MEATEKHDEVDQCHEKDRLRARLAVLEESIKSYEVECKASRQTVMRLVTELDWERRKAVSSTEMLDSLKVEFEGMVLGKKNTEMERQSLTEQLEASKRVIEATQHQSECVEKQVEELERKLHISQDETRLARAQLLTLMEKVYTLLDSDSEGDTATTEKDILHKLEDLCKREEKSQTTKAEMELRLSHASEELARQTELHHSALQRAQLAEQQVQDLRGRLEQLEAELLSAAVHRDGLNHDQQHYQKFLEELSETMKVDSIAVDLGFDMRIKLLLTRAEQLVKQEGTALAESQTLAYSLQRKLKAQKSRLEGKELHTELLRKKVVELEEEKRSRSALAVERDDAHLEARKLQKKVERLQGELKAAKFCNTELQAQLCHTNELKLKVMEQSQTMQEQSKMLKDVVEGKAEVEKTLSSVSSDLQSQEKKVEEWQQQLVTLRQTLAQLSERERELFDFRRVVSQMLGLDATALALPNYEIIKLLESLLHHQHHHHLHPHHALPWHCPTHQHLLLPQTQATSPYPNSSISLNASTSRSFGPEDATSVNES